MDSRFYCTLALVAAVALCSYYHQRKRDRKNPPMKLQPINAGYSGAGVTDIYGINKKPAHALSGANLHLPTRTFDPYVNQRFLLPYGHLRKRHDDAEVAALSRPVVPELIGVLAGASSDQPRRVQVGIREPVQNQYLEEAMRDKAPRRIVPDQMYGPVTYGVADTVLVHKNDHTNTRPSRIDYPSIPAPGRTAPAYHVSLESAKTVRDWSLVGGLANQDPDGVVWSAGPMIPNPNMR